MKRTAIVREKEEGFKGAVLEYAKLRGWRRAHFRPARTKTGWRTPVEGDGKGFPDLILVRRKDARLVVTELKSQVGTVEPEQQEWLDDFAAIPCAEVFIWRPSDWPEIEEVLK